MNEYRKINPILKADSYKASHFQQYPEGAEYVSSYIEARGCDLGWKETVFLGIQGFVKEYLLDPITAEDVILAENFAGKHGVPFNKEGWIHIVENHGGYLPIRIQALPEGTVIGLKNCLVQVVNTDPKVPWLTSYVETAMLRAIWYPTTVATQSREIKKTIKEFLMKTTGSCDGLEFMLHDFGARGVSSSESAQIGGMAHIVNFMGTDTMEGIEYASLYYNTDWVSDMPAFSVVAAEHSTVTSWGKENEAEMYRNMIRNAKDGQIVSIVSDSYNIFNACENIFGDELYEDVIDLGKRGGRLVVRPDSGDPLKVPVQCVSILIEKFGCTINSKGYKVLPDYIRVLQGDGIDQDSIRGILTNARNIGVAASNFVFGMGGGLLQQVNRDTLKFAMKASAIRIDGEWQDVYKDPIHGSKKSKKGRLSVYKWNDESESGFSYSTHRENTQTSSNQLQDVYMNGKLLVETNLNEIRERAAI